MPGRIGIVANPDSGKDIRRVVAHASVFDNRQKVSIVRRAVLGAVAGGCSDFVYLPDSHGLVEAAFDGLDADASFESLNGEWSAAAADTTLAATLMREAGCGVVITLGGDGTNRAFAKGWLDAPLIPISTGTNNVFPQMIEGTVAGAAAGCIASGKIDAASVASPCKVIHAAAEDEWDDLALVDAVLLNEPFLGAKPLWQAHRLRTIVLTRAEPASAGMSAVGGFVSPLSGAEDCALVLQIGPGGRTVTAPIAPGLYADVPVAEASRLALGKVVELPGPGVLAFDGERERWLRSGQAARCRVLRDGPRVVDVARTLRLAAAAGAFVTGA